MANTQHWSPGNMSLSTPDPQNAGIAIIPSFDLALSCAGVPVYWKLYLMCLPVLTILYRTLTSITTPFPGAVSQEPLAEQGSATSSMKVICGAGTVTRGFIDPSIQNGFPIPNSVGTTFNLTQLKEWTLS